MKILSDLIKFQTVSGTSNLALIEYCEKKLSKVGALSFRTSDEAKKRFNLFSTVKVEKKSKWEVGLFYQDILMWFPASAKEWSSDPFVSCRKK